MLKRQLDQLGLIYFVGKSVWSWFAGAGAILFLFGMVPITPHNRYKFATMIDVVSVEITPDSE